MTRVMCVYFPRWSLQRIQRDRPELRRAPFALTRLLPSKGSKVTACCGRAASHGVRPGMVAAEALAMLPSLTCVEEDLDADRRALIELAEWAERYSPIVGLEETIAPSCLFLDMTGGAACFGGEEALVRKTHAECRADGWTVRIALADALGAAWASAHDDAEPALCILPAAAGISSALSVAALRLSPGAVAILAQLGIERIGQLIALPRDQIAERFGREVGWRLDQAMGRVAEVIVPIHPRPEAAASWAFDDPVDRQDIIATILDRLLDRLQAVLQKRCCGTRLVECLLELDDATVQRFECSLSRPAQTAAYLRGLMHARLAQIRVPAPIRGMCVRAAVLECIGDEQPGLFDDGQSNAAALAQLLDSLASRMGREVVTRACLVADPLPELACRFDSALAKERRESVEEQPVFAHRPLRLLRRPAPIQAISLVPVGIQRFHYAGADYAVVRCQGPERIQTGWWRGDDVQRDYFLVETTHGTHWWIYQRIDDGRWFLHGCFD